MTHLVSTSTPVSEITTGSLVDLEALGGGGFRDEYGVFGAHLHSFFSVTHEGTLYLFPGDASTELPVITYALSNMLEREPS